MRFFPAMLLSLALWTLAVQTVRMAWVSTAKSFEALGGICSVAWFF